MRLAYARALDARGMQEEACGAILVARRRLKARANKISDPVRRQSFLELVRENVETMELARRWIDETEG